MHLRRTVAGAVNSFDLSRCLSLFELLLFDLVLAFLEVMSPRVTECGLDSDIVRVFLKTVVTCLVNTSQLTESLLAPALKRIDVDTWSFSLWGNFESFLRKKKRGGL